MFYQLTWVHPVCYINIHSFRACGSTAFCSTVININAVNKVFIHLPPCPAPESVVGVSPAPRPVEKQINKNCLFLHVEGWRSSSDLLSARQRNIPNIIAKSTPKCPVMHKHLSAHNPVNIPLPSSGTPCPLICTAEPVFILTNTRSDPLLPLSLTRRSERRNLSALSDVDNSQSQVRRLGFSFLCPITDGNIKAWLAHQPIGRQVQSASNHWRLLYLHRNICTSL